MTLMQCRSITNFQNCQFVYHFVPSDWFDSATNFSVPRDDKDRGLLLNTDATRVVTPSPTSIFLFRKTLLLETTIPSEPSIYARRAAEQMAIFLSLDQGSLGAVEGGHAEIVMASLIASAQSTCRRFPVHVLQDRLFQQAFVPMPIDFQPCRTRLRQRQWAWLRHIESS
jgi:hypothetical protein